MCARAYAARMIAQCNAYGKPADERRAEMFAHFRRRKIIEKYMSNLSVFRFPSQYINQTPNPWIIHGLRGYDRQPRFSSLDLFKIICILQIIFSHRTAFCDWGTYFNSLKRKWEAPSASSFVGGSMAMSLFYRRKNYSCARRKSKKGWSEVA